MARITTKICGLNFDIIERTRNSRDDDNMGKCDPKELKIFIDDGLPQDQETLTLIHEWLHAVLCTYAIDHTEILVNAIAVELFRSKFNIQLTHSDL